MLRRGFNSTLVRLNQEGDDASFITADRFQFHSGAIKSIPWRVAFALQKEFQFHSGAIKSQSVSPFSTMYTCFNSTLVRLNLVHATR